MCWRNWLVKDESLIGVQVSASMNGAGFEDYSPSFKFAQYWWWFLLVLLMSQLGIRIGRRPVRCVGGDMIYILRHQAPSDTLVQRRREMTDFPSKSCSFLLRKPKKKNIQIRCLVYWEKWGWKSSLPCFGSNKARLRQDPKGNLMQQTCL